MCKEGKIQKAYLLILKVKGEIKAGKLPEKYFDGIYIYVGSANGKIGYKRVKRHIELALGLRNKKKWHIDYLLEKGKLLGVILIQADCKGKLECKIAELLLKKGYKIAVKRFGSTDCKCEAHLFKIQ